LLLTQNNPGNLYFASSVGISGKWIHNALMGDPTLRNDVVAPVSNVIATVNGNHCNVTWTSSPDNTVLGYHLYVRNDSVPEYTRVNAQLITGNSFTDSCLIVKGIHDYQVRAMKLENTPSGSYFNLSEGISDTAYNSLNIAGIAAFTHTVNGVSVSFNTPSTLTVNYSWDFGNGQNSTSPNPTVTYSSNGSYTVQLIATHPCYEDTGYAVIDIYEVGLNGLTENGDFQVYPNPSKGLISISGNETLVFYLSVYNTEGKEVYVKEAFAGNSILDISALPKGLYLLKLRSGSRIELKKLVLD
jgi:hypothetical protein